MQIPTTGLKSVINSSYGHLATGSWQGEAPRVMVDSPSPLLAPTRYEVVARWEHRLPGRVQRTILSRYLTVSSEAHGPDRRVTLTATSPVLRQPDLTALEELVTRLAVLYQRLVLRVAPTGHLQELLNHPEISQTWAVLEPMLAACFGGGPDELTAALLAAVGQQVQQPASVLASLAYDYAYAFLLTNVPLTPEASERERTFPHFFADTSLSFREQLLWLPAPAPGQVSCCLHGSLDDRRTDRAAVAHQVAAELAAALVLPPPVPDSLVFAYTATYVLDAATGWPVRLAATVSCQGPAGYAKEYDLTIQQL